MKITKEIAGNIAENVEGFDLYQWYTPTDREQRLLDENDGVQIEKFERREIFLIQHCDFGHERYGQIVDNIDEADCVVGVDLNCDTDEYQLLERIFGDDWRDNYCQTHGWEIEK